MSLIAVYQNIKIIAQTRNELLPDGIGEESDPFWFQVAEFSGPFLAPIIINNCAT